MVGTYVGEYKMRVSEVIKIVILVKMLTKLYSWVFGDNDVIVGVGMKLWLV